ncbi:MAG: hypothetical protein IPL79_13430 [Myxococcales bacterium]|nr:hypothetical protein [Myxococcales bacterium]
MGQSGISSRAAAWVVPLAAASDAHGNKAAGLARLVRAAQREHASEFEVPRGVAISIEAHAAWLAEPGAADAVLVATSQAALRSGGLVGAAGSRWIVRSSSRGEDGASRTGAGVFESIEILGLDELAGAIAVIWRSAHGDVAKAYGVAGAPMGVVVQRFQAGASVVAHVMPGATSVLQWREPGAASPLAWTFSNAPNYAQGAVRAARAIHDVMGFANGTDIELVVKDDKVFAVQARPLPPRHVRVANTPEPTIFAFSREMPEVIWKLDITHNPAPLSLAQTELVHHVVRTGWSPTPLRVVGGYLYYANQRAEPAATPTPRTADELRAAMTPLAADIEAGLAVPTAAPSLHEALAVYGAFYQRWTTAVVPLLRAARTHVAADGQQAIASASRANAPAAILRQMAHGQRTLADGMALLANVASAWDVAAPTWGEEPARVAAWVAHYRGESDHRDKTPTEGLAAELAYWEEADDYWFYAAQAIVRRALLAMGHARGIGADVMWVPWAVLASPALTAVELTELAQQHRAAQAEATRLAMPLAFANGQALAPTANAADRNRFAGTSVGGISLPAGGLIGVVVNLAHRDGLALVDVADRIVICANITPATALAVAGARAIVAVTGGPLDHGAAIAHELGMPTIVGCAGCTTIPDGAVVALQCRRRSDRGGLAPLKTFPRGATKRA